MRLLLLIGIVFVTQVFAQKIPPIKSQGKSVREFVPKGWFIKDSATGDLNKDKKSDVVLVLQCADSANIVQNEDFAYYAVDTNRRLLLILFRESEGYVLIENTSTFILNHTQPNFDDPYDGIKVINNVLHIKFKIFANAGSWFASTHVYKFQFRGEAFYLIGAESCSFHRASWDSKIHSYNFLTRKKKSAQWQQPSQRESPCEKPPREAVRWEKIKVKQLKTFKTFIAPFTWDEGNINL